MASLRKFLLDKKYTRIKLYPTNTNHLGLSAQINGIEGNFILDTGASSSCIDFKAADLFALFSEESEVMAAGAGAVDMPTAISKANTIQIGKWSCGTQDLVLFDLSHVNQALEDHNAQAIHGILGADILNRGKGIIDYQYNCLYLKCKQ